MKKLISLLLTLLMILTLFTIVPVSAASGVCSIGSQPYGSLKAAINAANNMSGDVTISLTSDVTLSEQVTFSGSCNLTIDGSGYKINNNTALATAWQGLIQITGTGTFTAKNFDFTHDIDADTNLNSAGIFYVNNPSAKLVIDGGKILGKTLALIQVNSGTVEVNNARLESLRASVFATYCTTTATISVTNSIIINSCTASNLGIGFIQPKGNDASNIVSVTFDNCSLIATGYNAQNVLNILGKNSGTSTVTLTNCKTYNTDGKSTFLVEAGGTLNLTNTSVYAPYTTTGDSNKVPVRNMGGTVNINNSYIFGGNNWSAVSYNSTNSVAANISVNCIAFVDSYTQTGNTAPSYNVNNSKTYITPAVNLGASVRCDEGTSGIRFTSFVTTDALPTLKALADENTEVTYGTVVAKADDVAAKLNISISTSVFDKDYTYITMDLLDAVGINYLNIEGKHGISDRTNGWKDIRAAVYNIDASNYETDLVFFAYAKVIVNGQALYFYSSFKPANQTRSIKTVATAALADSSANYTAEELAVLHKYAD